MTVAFVLSGGARLGAIQIGMLRALDELADVWLGMRRRRVFPGGLIERAHESALFVDDQSGGVVALTG